VSTQILPFGAWLPVLQTDGLADDRATLAALPPGVRADLARLLPAFEEAGQPRPAGPADATRLFEAVAKLLDVWSRKQPLVVVLEDLHWADEMSLRLLAFVIRRLGSAPLLVLGSAREEEIGDAPLLRGVVEELTAERRLALLHVGPLSEASTGALVRTLAPAAPVRASTQRLEAQVWAASGGNPFVTVETVRALAEGAHPQASGAPRLPERVRQLVSGRRERLTDLGGRLADVAAVIGRDFEFALLRAASGLGDAPAAEAAEELVRRRVLRITGQRFEFVHDRIREVIYDRLLPPRRALLHRQVADALEALTPGGNESRLGELGAHYHTGEVWTKAVAYLRRAGARALDQAASISATEHFERALDALGHLPRDAESLAAAVDLRLDLRNSLHAGGDIRGGQEHLPEAERLAATLGDRRRGGLAAAQLAGSLVQFGETEAARAAAERALGLAASLAEPRIAVLARTYLGYAHYAVGAYPAAERCFEDNVTALGGDLYVERFETAFIPYVVSLVMRAWALAERGAFPEALRSLEAADRAGEDADHPYSRVYVSRGRGLVALRRGDVGGAVLALERARHLDRSTGLTLIRPMLLGGLGHAYTLAGRVDEALPLLQEAAKEGEAMGTVIWQSLRIGWLGEALLLSGQLEAAGQAAADALALAQTHGQRGWEAYALKLAADIAAQRDEADSARETCGRAMALAEELGMQPLAAHCHAAVGGLHGRAGDRAPAAAHLTRAVEIYRELGMTHELGAAEAALRGAAPA
jgi:tetratricopeptide (TPR) repeat protein